MLRRPLLLLIVAAAALAALGVRGLLVAAGGHDPWASLGGLAAALAAGGAVGAFVLARQGRLLGRFVDALERFVGGEFGHRLGHTAPDSLRPLARALDESFATLGHRIRNLERARAQLEAVLAGMVEGVVVVNGAGRVQLVNEAAHQMLRLADPVVGRNYLELIRHPDISSLIHRVLAGEQPAGIELALGRDASRTFIARATPVTGAGDAGAVLVLHDISDLRRADRVRRDFVANVSHELRTPLTAIRGYVEALLEAPPPPEDAHRFLEIIARHSRRMELLVKDLLRLARLDAGQEVLERTPCSVEGLVSGVLGEIGPVLEGRGQELRLEVSEGAATVLADPAKLHDVVRNLVENASNYSPGESLIEIAARRDGAHVVLEVLDQGPGIPVADLQRIFERFYRVDKARSRETGGTGLGLAIVRHLVGLHGGDVSAANRPGGGAVFTVRIPAG
ncbi:MAG: PAS domain-containing protein [Vicinamibacteraceae bacterium]|nr:PAS domain-containing protein [Vicinamibacteraceae bacterium]